MSSKVHHCLQEQLHWLRPMTALTGGLPSGGKVSTPSLMKKFHSVQHYQQD
jgi:hypothetical protein